jgi:hypothetical protein
VTDDRMEQIIDALEYRLAQLEDRVLKEANDTDRRSLRHRREVYYRIMNKATAHA